jgi:ParB-like nuclease domain
VSEPMAELPLEETAATEAPKRGRGRPPMSEEQRAAKEQQKAEGRAAAEKERLREQAAKVGLQLVDPVEAGTNPSIIEFPIAGIRIGKRHRKEMGDLEELARSIEREGLLQPIGITEARELVFGERRIRAYELLGRDKISVRIVHVSSIARGEHDENELRKEFTHSERDAIRRSLGHKPEGRPSDYSADLPSYAEGAASVGYSERTARNVESVVDHGTPDLVAAMDKGEVSIDAAATIAKQPPSEQTRLVELPKNERREAVRELRSAGKRGGKPLLDLAVRIAELASSNAGAGEKDGPALLQVGDAIQKVVAANLQSRIAGSSEERQRREIKEPKQIDKLTAAWRRLPFYLQRDCAELARHCCCVDQLIALVGPIDDTAAPAKPPPAPMFDEPAAAEPSPAAVQGAATDKPEEPLSAAPVLPAAPEAAPATEAGRPVTYVPPRPAAPVPIEVARDGDEIDRQARYLIQRFAVPQLQRLVALLEEHLETVAADGINDIATTEAGADAPHT